VVAALNQRASDTRALEKQPVARLILLAQLLFEAKKPRRATAVLWVAWQRFPGDFWANYLLGTSSTGPDGRPEQPEEAVRFLTAALAARPASVITRYNLGIALSKQGKQAAAIDVFRQIILLAPRFARAHANLGLALSVQAKQAEAEAPLRRAIALDPGIPGIHAFLGRALAIQGKQDEAIAAFREAVRRNPRDANAYKSRGVILLGDDRREYESAADCFRKAVAIDPRDAEAHTFLGRALSSQGRKDDAIVAFREAIRLNSRDADAHNHLGSILCDVKRDYEGAIDCFRRAIDLDFKGHSVHANLGNALLGQGKGREAEAAYRRALEIDDRDGTALKGLAAALTRLGKADEAIDVLHRTVNLYPMDADAHVRLGSVQLKRGKMMEAVAALRKASKIDRKHINALIALGATLIPLGRADEARTTLFQAAALGPKGPQVLHTLAFSFHLLATFLLEQGKADEAIPIFRKAIQTEPTLAEAHCGLGSALRQQGRLGESLEAYRRGHTLALKQPDWRYPSAMWRRYAERLVRLEKNLPDLLSGKIKPTSPSERIDYAKVCNLTRRHQLAAHLYAEAFAAEPKLADDLKASHRYNAVCAAALAAAGGGEPRLVPDRLQYRLRRQALTWLRADLAACGNLLERGDVRSPALVAQRLKHWQSDNDLGGLRDPDAVARLPADEQAAWKKLWADVQALLERASRKK
jgi:tetratricopeptide (TPR) repeat protein